MNKKYIIYIHKNKINNKVYIGQTCNISARWGGNGIHYKSNAHFYSAIQKYGWDNFEHIIIEKDLTLSEANELEEFYIQEFEATNPEKGYNIALGGNNAKKPYISNYLKEQWQKEEYREKMLKILSGENSHFFGVHRYGELNPMYGKHHSDETKKKISDKAKQRHLENPDKFKGKNNPASKRVLCITTGEIFETQRDAAKWAGVGTTTMSRWLNKKQKTTGFHPITKEPLEWKYMEKEN